jgi:hypothetical protein
MEEVCFALMNLRLSSRGWCLVALSEKKILVFGLNEANLKLIKFKEMRFDCGVIRWRLSSMYEGASGERIPLRSFIAFRIFRLPRRLRTVRVIQALCKSFVRICNCLGLSP